MNRKELALEISKIKGGLSAEDSSLIDEFFNKLKRKISLSGFQSRLLQGHFIKTFEYYLDHGYSIRETCELIDPSHLGDFFLDRSREDYDLDNAAIVYPLGMKFGQMPMFRLSVTLKEDIVPEILQLALYFTIKRFPTFSTVVKTGFFWHYLESVHNLPLLEEENDIPCKPISIVLRSRRSFRVFYFKKRISIEFFHVITDGSGGMVFLKSLTAEYLKLLGSDVTYSDDILDIDSPVDEAELVNEFSRAKGDDNISTFLDKSSLQLDGKLSPVKPCRIIHYEMDLSELKAVTKKYGGTVTAYILGILFLASKKAVSKKEGVFNIQVPVNMRKFNKSKTLRNYSMYFNAVRDINDIPELWELVLDMDRQIKEKGDEKVMNQMMMATGKIIKMVSPIPVFLKNPVVQLAYGYLGNRIIAYSFSNLGKINTPEEMSLHTDHFDFMLPPVAPNRASVTMTGYKDKTRLTVVKATKDSRFEEEILRLLEKDGLKVNLEGSIEYES